MKSKLTKSQAEQKIYDFFQKDVFSSEEMRKIKRLAMKHKIKLGERRKQFCKRCLHSLKGKTRITKTYKTVICEKCGFRNKYRIY